MTTENSRKPQRLGRNSTIGIIGVAAVLSAVYLFLGPSGNSGADQSCGLSMEMAKNIKPFATGEVAAFRPAEKPLDLKALKFDGETDKPKQIGDYSGKTVLLNLWATWCAPCRKEMPALDKLQADMGSNDFEVLAVNVDRGGTEKPMAFLDQINVKNLTFHHDGSNQIITDLRTHARATGLPTTIMIGPDGCEVGTMYGPAEWASGEAKELISQALGFLKKPTS